MVLEKLKPNPAWVSVARHNGVNGVRGGNVTRRALWHNPGTLSGPRQLHLNTCVMGLRPL